MLLHATTDWQNAHSFFESVVTSTARSSHCECLLLLCEVVTTTLSNTFMECRFNHFRYQYDINTFFLSKVKIQNNA